MSDYTKQKPKLTITILKAQIEALRKQINSRPDFLGMKNSLKSLSAELENTSVLQERMKEIAAELALYERLLRERLEQEAKERKEQDSPFDKIGKAFTGEMEI